MADDPRVRISEAEAVKQQELHGFAGFVSECCVAVDDARAEPFEVRQQMARVEDRALGAAQVSRRTHAIEEEGELLLVARGVELMGARIDADVMRAAPVEFGKQRAEPVRVFMINGYGQRCMAHRLDLLKRKRPPPSSGPSV